jgi:hypothetical protein
VVQIRQKVVKMLDAMTQIAPWQVMGFCILLMASIIVVVEAAKSSREILWGDLFSDDEWD